LDCGPAAAPIVVSKSIAMIERRASLFAHLLVNKTTGGPDGGALLWLIRHTPYRWFGRKPWRQDRCRHAYPVSLVS
jgi:hypothetical protein